MLVSAMVPYDVHYDDETVITSEEALVQVIKVDGLLFDSLSAEQIKRFEQQRNTVFRTIASSDLTVYVTFVRRKVTDFPDGVGGTWFSQQFNKRLRQRYESRGFYINDIYISLVRRRFRAGMPGLMDRAIALMTGTEATKNEAESLDAMADSLYKASNLVLRSLADYGTRRLRVQRHPEPRMGRVDRETAFNAVQRFQLQWHDFKAEVGDLEVYEAEAVHDFLGEEFCELSSFFNYLINLDNRKVPVSDLLIRESLPYARLNFRVLANMCEIRGSTESKIGAMLSMGEWPRRTPSRMLDKFLQQPVEFIITQSFTFQNRIEAEQGMLDETRRMTVDDKHNISEDDQKELKQGISDLRRGNAVNGAHHLTIFVHVSSLPMTTETNREINRKRLDHAVGLVEGCFVEMLVKPVREWSQP